MLDRKIKKRIDFIKGGSVTRIITKSEGETTTKTIRAPDNLSGIQAGFDGFLGGSVRGTGGNSAEGILVAVEEAFEIAETKVAQVMDCASQNQHPLQCTIEKE